MIDAEFRSEERFSRLTLAHENNDEKTKINCCIDSITAKYTLKPEIYSTTTPNNKEIIIVEYHDDTNKKAEKIFEEIIKTLNIKICN